jgi:hypothetical protein
MLVSSHGIVEELLILCCAGWFSSRRDSVATEMGDGGSLKKLGHHQQRLRSPFQRRSKALHRDTGWGDRDMEFD